MHYLQLTKRGKIKASVREPFNRSLTRLKNKTQHIIKHLT